MPREFQQIGWDDALEAECRRVIRAAVLEDLDRSYDWTTVALVPAEAVGQADIVARGEGVIAGLRAAALVSDEMDKSLEFVLHASDGAIVSGGDTVASMRGPVRSLLAAERLTLNLLGRLSGIATLTRQYVEAVAGTKARIYDTRKTTPGWRRLEKYAAGQGGGHNHRTGLFDAILIKDNHVAFVSEALAAAEANAAAPSASEKSIRAVGEAIRRARAFLATAFDAQTPSTMIVEVEVDSLAQLEAALAERPDIVLLDNMTSERLREAVQLRNDKAPEVELEASGGVNLSTVRGIAETGVDRISVGALTHSAKCLDLGLDWV